MLLSVLFYKQEGRQIFCLLHKSSNVKITVLLGVSFKKTDELEKYSPNMKKKKILVQNLVLVCTYISVAYSLMISIINGW